MSENARPENTLPAIQPTGDHLFENSLMESAALNPPNSKWMMLGSVLLQAAGLAALLIYPLFYPEALPRQTSLSLLAAPPESRAPATPRPSPTAGGPMRPKLATLDLSATNLVTTNLATTATRLIAQQPSEGGPPGESEPATGPFQVGIKDGMPNILNATPQRVVRLEPPQRISAGVAAGRLLSPIQVAYPHIAQQARIEGTVTIEATISRKGTIENARVVAGPALLRDAALNAVGAARYRPFLLSGQPVEVQTTVNVVFTLGVP